MSFQLDAPQGTLSITLKGDVEGATITNGKGDFGAVGPGEWTAIRSKP